MDLLIDLMASVNSMNKAVTRAESLKGVLECERSLKAIESRLQSFKQRAMDDTHENVQFP